MGKEKDWDDIFRSIVEGVEVQEDVSFDEVDNETIQRSINNMNLCATVLGKHLIDAIHGYEGEMPEELAVYIKELIDLTDAIIDIMTDCNCEECEAFFEDLEDED